MDAIAIGAEEGHVWVEDCGGEQVRKTRYFTDVRMTAGREKPETSRRWAMERWVVDWRCGSTSDLESVQSPRI